MSTSLVDFAGNVARAPSALDVAIDVALGESAQLGEQVARRSVPHRSGRFARSITGRVIGPGEARLASDLEWAKMREEGGIQRGSPMLAVPVGLGLGHTPRQVAGLRVARSGSGQMMLVDVAGRVWFLLRRQVRQPASHGIRAGQEAMVSEAQAQIDRRTRDLLARLA